ncbi:MAG: hypothetical protein V1659_04780 [Candidatus Woesearchaeota archaeon]
MVFEKFYTTEYINTHKYLIFVISVAYTVFGIATSLLLFNEFNQSLTSLAFIALMLLVTFKDLLKINLEPGQSDSFKKIFTQYRHTAVIFAFIFAGVFFRVCYFEHYTAELCACNNFQQPIKLCCV